MTGIKKEGRSPHIFDERPDSSVKIIVLDLRSNDDSNTVNHNQPASKFKKMPLDFWENVLHIIRAYKPNQITDSPIQASATVDVYTNIIPSRQPLPAQQQPQQPTMLPHISPHPPISSFNPAMLHPAMYPNNSLLYNQHNYMNVLTAAQYIMNAAAAYNSMLSQQQQQQQQQKSKGKGKENNGGGGGLLNVCYVFLFWFFSLTC